MSAPVLKILFSPNDGVFGAQGTHILAMSDRPEHTRLVQAIGALSPIALDILGWLHALSSKPALMVPKYKHEGRIKCVLYMFDLQRCDHKPFLKKLGARNTAVLMEQLGLVSEAQLIHFLGLL